MALNNNNNGYGGNRGGQGGGYGARPQPVYSAPVAEQIPEDYAAAADKVITAVGIKISTSKLRNFFGLFSDMYNDVKRASYAELTSEQVTEITGARIRMIYECGRNKNVNDFVDKAKLINYLLGIGKSTAKFIRFYHYFEALVAYHRYHHGYK